MPKPGLVERFWRDTEKRGPADCWPWRGQMHYLGYGRIACGSSRYAYAHRVSYELNVGPIPAGMDILHSCDNRACVNPAHLSPGTHTENMRQMRERGRQNVARGEACGGAKLTEEQVREIRAAQKFYGSRLALARKYGVDKTLIWLIQTRRLWKHV